LALDSCIASIFEPGNIATDSGAITIPRYAIQAIIIEAASATDTVSAGFAYAAAVVEAASAADTFSAPVVGTVAETVTAVDTPGATVVSGTVLATLDGVATRVTLSNGNLTATYNGGGTNNSGARSATVKSTGKYYYEVTPGTMRNGDCVAILLSTGTYNDMDNLGTNCTTVYGSGAIWSNNANTGKSITAWAGAPGPAIGVAVDLGARRGWFRRGSGNWNGDAAANPATGVGGVTIAASGSFGPAIGFTGNSGDSGVANFGQSAFANPAPSGFGNWTT
jgi:hypothetical protein